MNKVIIKIFQIFLIFVLIFSFSFKVGLAKNQNSDSKKEPSKTDQKKPTFVPGEIIVKFKESINPNKDKSLKDLEQNLGGESWQSIFKGKASQKLNVYKKKVMAGSEAKAIEKLSKHPGVEYVELNQIIYTEMIPNDPFYSSSGSWGQGFDDLWGIKKIQPESAWDLALGEGITVAVVDTGADYNHEDLAQNIWNNPGEVGIDANGNNKNSNGLDDDGNGYIDDWQGWDASTIVTQPRGWSSMISGSKEQDNDPIDDNGHGTHVSGTIAAVGNNGVGVIGVAPKAKIMPVKFLTKDGVGTHTDAANALIYAAENGAEIINNSWGGSYSRLVHDAIKYVYSVGPVIVAAAGNSSEDNLYDIPSGFPEVISVSATDNTDSLAGFSSFGKVDVSAPGVGILSSKSSLDDSTYLNVGEKYRVASGTSMASPHVAGLIALILAQNSNLTSEEVRQVLVKSADDLGATGFDPNFGFGRINAQKALNETLMGQAVILAPVGHFDGNSVNVFGTVQAANFQEYLLEYGAGDLPQTWMEIVTSTTPKTNNLLGAWNTSGLAFGRYTIRLKVIDTSGNIYESMNRVDYGVPLEIFNLEAAVFSPTETIINWNTNRQSYSWVEYGKDTNYGKTAYPDSEIADFAVQLLDLEPSTTYHYRIIADEFAKEISSPDYTFTTQTPFFSIQNVNIALEPHQTTITWETDIPTTGLVQYNRTYWTKNLYYQYRNEAADANLSTTHSVVLSQLDDNQEYIFIIKSQDQNGNGATTSPTYFTTTQGQYPQVINFVSQNLTENSLDLVWNTDIPSTAEIRFHGANEVAYYDTVQQNDNNLAQHHEKNLTGLKPSTVYWLTIVSISTDGSRSYYNPENFRTPESSHISNLVVQPLDRSATVSWTTDIPTYSRVWYQAGALELYNYPTSYTSWSLTTNHSITLTGLLPETLYGFKVESFDDNNNDFFLNIGEFTTLLLDDQVPTGLIKINNDALYVNQTGVTLNLTATDNVSVTEMQFSNNGTIFNSWEPYSASKNWILSSGDGLKTVYVRFRDASGNISTTYSDSIWLDTTQPSNGLVIINNNAVYATSSVVALTLSAQDNVGVTEMQFCTDEGYVCRSDAWEPYSTTKFWTFYNGDGIKTIFVRFRDAAGNISQTYNDTISIDTTAPTGSILINNGAVSTKTRYVTLNLSASDNLGGTVQMRFSNDNITWTSWENFASTKKWTLTTGKGSKTVYVQYRDAAGNITIFSDSIKY